MLFSCCIFVLSDLCVPCWATSVQSRAPLLQVTSILDPRQGSHRRCVCSSECSTFSLLLWRLLPWLSFFDHSVHFGVCASNCSGVQMCSFIQFAPTPLFNAHFSRDVISFWSYFCFRFCQYSVCDLCSSSVPLCMKCKLFVCLKKSVD